MDDNLKLGHTTISYKNLHGNLLQNSLAVQVNRSRRIPKVMPICKIYGTDEEDGYDATMSCMKEKSLRQGLSNV
jgi:hypothetical protein